LTAKDGVQIEKDINNNKYSLTIPKINSNIHAGTVTIVAKNSIGSAQHNLTLNVNGNYICFYFISNEKKVFNLNFSPKILQK
jgi:hypothetical protein